jgi:hypothetical protein
MKQYIIIEKSEYHGDNIHGTYKTRKEAKYDLSHFQSRYNLWDELEIEEIEVPRYKVVIDWTDTSVMDDYGNQVDTRFFDTKEEAEAFVYGFESGNGYTSEPDLTIKKEEELVHEQKSNK